MSSLLFAALVALTNDFGCVQADTVGALVTSYVPAGGHEVFFLQSEARDVKGWYNGGVPVVWPWFNRNGDPGSIQHGFARLREWRLVSREDGKSESRALFRLEEADKYRLDYEVVLNASLTLRLVMRNLGKERFVVTTGLHPYFSVSDPGNVTVTTPKGKAIDCQAGMDDVIRSGEGTYDVADSGTGRHLSIRMFGNNKFIVWNVGPKEKMAGMSDDDWKRYICVEPAVLPRADGFYLEPGEERSIGMVCTAFEGK